MSIQVNDLTSSTSSGDSKNRQELMHLCNRALSGNGTVAALQVWLVECAVDMAVEGGTEAALDALYDAAIIELAP